MLLDGGKGEAAVSYEDRPVNDAVSEQFHEHEITDASQEPRPATLKRWLAIASLIFLYNISLGGFLTIAPVIDVINADLGPSPTYTWLASAWTVASGVGLLVAGSVSDLLGRRWFCISTGLLDIVAALIGALGKNLPTVIGAMAIMGLNGACAVNSFVAVAELVPTKHRGYVIGVMNGSAVFWVACGSLIGHEMALHTAPGWRSIFWLILATNVVGTVGVFATYFPDKPLAGKGKSKTTILKEFDYVGLLLIMIGPTLFLLGIIWVPQYGAKSARFIAPFVAGVVTLIALAFYETLLAKNPILHPFLFKRIRTFTMLLIIGAVGGMLFYALQAFFPTYLALLYDGSDGRKIGVDGIPFGIGTQLGGVGSAVLLPILGPRIGTTAMISAGVLLQVIFIPLMSLPGVTTKGVALAFSCIAGIGIGCMELLTILLIQLSCPDEWIGFANGAAGLARCFGGSIGTAVYSTIFQHRAQELVPKEVAAAALAHGLPQTSLPELLGILTGAVTTLPLSSVPGISPTIIEVSILAMKNAYRSSFQYVWYTAIPFGIISLACALATKDLSPHLTMKVAQHVKSESLPSEVNKDDAQVTHEKQTADVHNERARQNLSC